MMELSQLNNAPPEMAQPFMEPPWRTDKNSSEGLSDPESRLHEDLVLLYDAENIFKATSLLVIMVLSFTGNGAILVMIARNPQRRTVMNAFVCSLSSSDLLVTLFSMPLVFTASLIRRWPFGEIACILHHYVMSVSAICNSYAVLLIVAEIFLGVIQQSKWRIGKKMATVLLTFTWSVALVMSIPWNVVSIATNLLSDQGYLDENTCRVFQPPANDLEIYRYISIITLGHVLPIMLTMYCFVVLISKVYSVKTKVRPSVVPLSDMLFQSEMRTANTVILMISAYVVCWFPYVVMSSLSCVPGLKIATIWYDVAVWLTWADKAINPIIYAWRNRTLSRYFNWGTRGCCWRVKVRKADVYMCRESRDRATSIGSDTSSRGYSPTLFLARSSIDSDIALTEASGGWRI